MRNPRIWKGSCCEQPRAMNRLFSARSSGDPTLPRVDAVWAVRAGGALVAVELLLPFHHVGLAAVFLDQLCDVIAALARALGAFDAKHVELAFDVAEDEVGAGHWRDPPCRAASRGDRA